MGNRKKNDGGIWRKVTVWSAYLLADSIATMTAGILSNDLGDMYMHAGFLDANSELTAFWAPLLLLHLGGTDAITAYSVEDNELWRRHLFGVITQAVTTYYILLMAWTGSHLSMLFIVMFCVGLVKYLERVWVLYLASDNKFRDSISGMPIKESKIMEESRLKELEGYHLKTHQVLDVEVPDDFDNTSSSDANDNNANELRIAYSFLEMVKCLFADMILSFKDRDASKTVFLRDSMTWERRMRVIEIELGHIYDLLYTKANVAYTSWGIARRIIGILLTSTVLVVVSLDNFVREKQQYTNSKIDITITLVLLAVALLLEIYSLKELLLSDQTAHWLIKHNKTTILRVINRCACAPKKHRWSNSIGQLNLLSISLRQKWLPCRGILKKLHIDEMLEIYLYETHVPVVDDFKRYVYDQLINDADLKALYCRKDAHTHKLFENDDRFGWCSKFDFDQNILIWHIATEICDHTNPRQDFDELDFDEQDFEAKESSKFLSQYMLYLLVKHPYMLPIGMAHIRFQEIYTDVRCFIEEQLSKSVKVINQVEASNMLINVNTDFMLSSHGNTSYSVIFHACKLASLLRTRGGGYTWDSIRLFWMEMLCQAACQCKGRHHAQQLGRGGQLITHVWLLMAHLGFTDHFQITRSRATAEMFLG